MKLTSKSSMKVLACTVVALGAISMAQAQVSPTGAWTWTNAPGGRGGNGGRGGRGMGAGTNTLILTLDVDGKKVFGTFQGPPREGVRPNANPDDAATPPPAPRPSLPVAISNGKWASPTVTFDVVLPVRNGGNDTTNNYKGTVTATAITGTITKAPRGGNGDPVVTDWTATKKP